MTLTCGSTADPQRVRVEASGDRGLPPAIGYARSVGCLSRRVQRPPLEADGLIRGW